MARKGPTPDFDQVNLFWAGVNLDESPASGTLELRYNRTDPMLDDDAQLPVAIYPTNQVKTISTTIMLVEGESGVLEERAVGYASWRVPATNDPNIQGSGGTYTLTEKLDNGLGVVRTFVADKDAGSIWLNRITSVTPQPGQVISAVSVADFQALTARVEAVEGGGTGGGAALDAESVQDIVAAFLRDANGNPLPYNDAGNLLSIPAQGTGTGTTDAEVVRDTIASAVQATAPLNFVPDDTGDKLVFSLTAGAVGAAILAAATHLVALQAIGLTGADGLILYSRLTPGTRVTLFWDVSQNRWEDVQGTAMTGRPGGRNDLLIDFVGGSAAVIPTWGNIQGDHQLIPVAS